MSIPGRAAIVATLGPLNPPLESQLEAAIVEGSGSQGEYEVGIFLQGLIGYILIMYGW